MIVYRICVIYIHIIFIFIYILFCCLICSAQLRRGSPIALAAAYWLDSMRGYDTNDDPYR